MARLDSPLPEIICRRIARAPVVPSKPQSRAKCSSLSLSECVVNKNFERGDLCLQREERREDASFKVGQED